MHVIQRGRGEGKTYSMMDEIHDHIVLGSRQSILVVLLDMAELQWFSDDWAKAFPSIPRPDYCVLNNTLRIRGRRYEHVYVENVDRLDEGIYDERFETIWSCLPSTVTFTSSPSEFTAHSRAQVTVADVIKRYKRGRRKG